MVLLAIPVGVAAVIVALRLMTTKQDWFAKMNAFTHARADRERYPIGYAGARFGIPLGLLLWGILMALYGLSGAVRLLR